MSTCWEAVIQCQLWQWDKDLICFYLTLFHIYYISLNIFLEIFFWCEYFSKLSHQSPLCCTSVYNSLPITSLSLCGSPSNLACKTCSASFQDFLCAQSYWIMRLLSLHCFLFFRGLNAQWHREILTEMFIHIMGD